MICSVFKSVVIALRLSGSLTADQIWRSKAVVLLSCGLLRDRVIGGAHQKELVLLGVVDDIWGSSSSTRQQDKE
jgi:hypothetical protein